MLRYFIRRIILLVITLLILNLITFVLAWKQPGGFAAEHSNAIASYFNYVWHNLHGQLGISLTTGQPLFKEIIVAFSATLELCIAAFIISMVIGIPLGTLAGIFQKHWVRQVIMSLTMIGYSIPVFWLAILFVMNFALELNWFPISGRYNILLHIPNVTGFAVVDAFMLPPGQRSIALLSVLHHLVLPASVIAILPTTEVIRQLSIAMGKVMQENYIKAATIKGLSKTEVIINHALRNTLPSIFPNLGLQFGSVLTMAMVTEIVFSWPGIGRWFIAALYQHDYQAIRSGVLVVASFVICATILTDLLTALLYPIRRQEIYEQR